MPCAATTASSSRRASRITSYNVCYTKLFRVPTADRDALVALAVGHLLGDDLAKAFPASGAPADPAQSLFGSLDQLLAEGREPTIRASIRLDGAPVWSSAFARARNNFV